MDKRVEYISEKWGNEVPPYLWFLVVDVPWAEAVEVARRDLFDNGRESRIYIRNLDERPGCMLAKVEKATKVALELNVNGKACPLIGAGKFGSEEESRCFCKPGIFYG